MTHPEESDGREDSPLPGGDIVLFGRYRVLREIGRGGTGVVLLARDLELDVEIAIKLVPDLLVRDTEALEDLKREVLRGVALTHPGIVRTHGFERDETMGGIVMEFVDGGHFADLQRLQGGDCFDAEDLLPWLEQLAPALDYAHFDIGIAHRDLKPRNLMYTRAGRIKVADFGISSTIGDSFTRVTVPGPSGGTPEYMSPQQIMGERPSHLDDIYALGATIYELLTGKPPFYRGPILAQVKSSLPETMAVRREELGVTGKARIPAAWEQTIAGCLEKDSARRPRSAGEVLARLKAPATDRLRTESLPLKGGGDDPTSQEPPRTGQRARGKRSVWAVPFVTLVATLLGGFVFVESQKPPRVRGSTELPPAPLRITSPAELPAGTAGSLYQHRLTAEGGSGHRAWSVATGMLPEGLVIDRTSGTVRGVPMVAGETLWLVRVADAEGAITGKKVSLVVHPRVEDPLPSGRIFGPELPPIPGPDSPPVAGPEPLLGPPLPEVGSKDEPVVDPEMSRSWIWEHQDGRKIEGIFDKVSGDVLTISQDGRVVDLSLSRLADKSARRARKFAGIPEAPEAPDAGFGLQPQARRLVKAGRFDMGSPADEPGREESDGLPHRVHIRADFLMKATEVTWAEWNSVRARATANGYTDLSVGTNGVGGDESGTHPVLGITWWDAIKWCNLMSQRDGKKPVYHVKSPPALPSILKTGTPSAQALHVDWKADGYRLPTEAEWEFACRPGLSKRAFHSGPISKLRADPNLNKAGWYADNSDAVTHPVARKDANRLGLYDMHGNAAEWCWDYFGPLKQAEAFDPRGPQQGVYRVVRGGSWNDPVKNCRAATRASRTPTLLPNPFVGFRWVCAVPSR